MSAFGFDSGFGVSLVEFVLTWWLQSAVLIVIGLSAAAFARQRGPASQSAIYRVTRPQHYSAITVSSTSGSRQRPRLRRIA